MKLVDDYKIDKFLIVFIIIIYKKRDHFNKYYGFLCWSIREKTMKIYPMMTHPV